MAKIGKPHMDTPMRPEAQMGSEKDQNFHAIATEILQAVHGGSPSDLASALKAFAHELQMEDEAQDKDDSEGE